MTDIDQLWRPDGNHVPQYDLAWRRFQAELTTEYIDWQVKIVREYASDDQFITTCIDPMRNAVHDGELGQVLDVIASNQYLATQSELDPDVVGDYAFPPSGSWAPFFVADRSRGIRQERFLVTETDASSIGFPWFNFPSYDGQWRQVGWAMIARGARAVSYWHWHTMHASWESYWGGILPHSLIPGRVYEQIAGLRQRDRCRRCSASRAWCRMPASVWCSRCPPLGVRVPSADAGRRRAAGQAGCPGPRRATSGSSTASTAD